MYPSTFFRDISCVQFTINLIFTLFIPSQVTRTRLHTARPSHHFRAFKYGFFFFVNYFNIRLRPTQARTTIPLVHASSSLEQRYNHHLAKINNNNLPHPYRFVLYIILYTHNFTGTPTRRRRTNTFV